MTTTKRYFRKPLALLMLAALGASMMILLASRAQAADFVVTNTNDSGPGSLRDAIQQANASTGVADTISFQDGLSGTIPLASTLDVTDSAGLAIDGGGANITVSGGGSVRVFSVASGANLDLRNLTVAGGNTNGAGGGISNAGTLTVTNSTFSGNSATAVAATATDGAGGGISNAGTLTVTNSTFSGNSATAVAGTSTTGVGGGISNAGTLTVTNSIFSGNSAADIGGGIYNDSAGTLKVSDSTFSDNETTDQSGNNLGGGIFNFGTLEVSDSTFSGNRSLLGGGITNFSSTTPPATVTNSTFSGNSASEGGGIFNDGTLEVSNSTFSGNSAEFFGGGVSNDSAAKLTVTNSTFSGNSASDEFFGGGGLFNESDAPPPGSAVITLSNTIVANSPSGGNCGGTITDDGGNLVWPDARCPGLSANPLLGPLADNGGPTQTHALQPGSAAINSAVNCPPPATDQRGVSRPQGPACDIGAYEVEVEVEDTTPPTVTHTSPDGTVSRTATVTATFDEEVQNVTSSTFILERQIAVKKSPPKYVLVDAMVTPPSGTNLTAVLDPVQDLPKGTYRATITTDVTDMADNALEDPVVWTFTVAKLR